MAMKALFLNCTLKKSPQVSNTCALIDKAVVIFKGLDVESEVIRVVDHNIAFGVSSDAPYLPMQTATGLGMRVPAQAI